MSEADSRYIQTVIMSLYNISVVLFSCFKKFKCLGDVLASVSLPEFAKLRSQLLDVFIISSDFDLAQHFFCSVKTVECGQLFILACGQLRKKAQHNFIGQFQNLLKVPTDSVQWVYRGAS